MTRWISVLIVLPCIACSSTNTPSRDVAGGSTEDFTGDVDACTTITPFDLEETTPLGWSGADVLANAAGSFEVPIRWMSMCQQSNYPCAVANFCDGDSPDRPMSALAGTETTVSIEIEARDAPVRVVHRTSDDQQCGEGMSVPITLRVETADGALAEFADEFLSSSNPDTRESLVGLSLPVSELQGSLSGDSALPESALFRMVFGFYRDKAWMEINVETAGSKYVLPVPLLSDLLPPFESCALDIPRADVAR